MCALSLADAPADAAGIVRSFFASLSEGRLVEALNLLSIDAVLTDEGGHDARGIRAVTSSLLLYRSPRTIGLDRVESRGRDVSAILRMPRAKRYRGFFRVERGRIRSLRLERMR